MDQQIVDMPVNFSGFQMCQAPVSCDPLVDTTDRASDIGIAAGREKRIFEVPHIQRQRSRQIQVKNVGAFSIHF
jgi:hypothetical protein